MIEKISVVLCTRNEERRIEGALKGIALNDPDEIIVVDGASSDKTVEIAKRFTSKVVVSDKGSLTWDRQLGIDAARNDLIAMIDADHVLVKGDLESLVKDLKKYSFDIVQSQIVPFKNEGFWNVAEAQAWDLIQNIAGPRSMIGTAPALYRKKVFEKVRFDGRITQKIDDTDFIYRLSKYPEFSFGIGETRILQLHFGDFESYFKKFMWYGHGDGEFAHKHPERAHSILFHQLIRYPILHSAKAIAGGYFKAVPYFMFQGSVRFMGLSKYVFRHLTRKESL